MSVSVPEGACPGMTFQVRPCLSACVKQAQRQTDTHTCIDACKIRLAPAFEFSTTSTPLIHFDTDTEAHTACTRTNMHAHMHASVHKHISYAGDKFGWNHVCLPDSTKCEPRRCHSGESTPAPYCFLGRSARHDVVLVPKLWRDEPQTPKFLRLPRFAG